MYSRLEQWMTKISNHQLHVIESVLRYVDTSCMYMSDIYINTALTSMERLELSKLYPLAVRDVTMVTSTYSRLSDERPLA